jgi:alkylated DNA repair dioxygenase AlkB
MNKNIGKIQGLYYYPNMITEDEEKRFIAELDKETWAPINSLNKNSRQVQHYGYYYNYIKKKVDDPAPEMPDCLLYMKTLAEIKVYEIKGNVPEEYSPFLNQCIVNDYKPSQGIAAHIDNLDYGPYICCYTLGSGCEIIFSDNEQSLGIYVEPRSLYIMSESARYHYKHEIKQRAFDIIAGKTIQRSRRISATYREVPGTD